MSRGVRREMAEVEWRMSVVRDALEVTSKRRSISIWRELYN